MYRYIMYNVPVHEWYADWSTLASFSIGTWPDVPIHRLLRRWCTGTWNPCIGTLRISDWSPLLLPSSFRYRYTLKVYRYIDCSEVNVSIHGIPCIGTSSKTDWLLLLVPISAMYRYIRDQYRYMINVASGIGQYRYSSARSRLYTGDVSVH